ncbi:C6 transcription factor [Phlyctema vagabunda]|uniref:C6 transcription factor n=1 Tax=Phlyctema vagabunda TaxID=108571 RepID=A0ABR4PFP7_9HELO
MRLGGSDLLAQGIGTESDISQMNQRNKYPELYDNGQSNGLSLDHNMEYENTMDNGMDPTSTTFDDPFHAFSFSGIPSFNSEVLYTPGQFSQNLDFNIWDIDLDSVELAYQDLTGTTPGGGPQQQNQHVDVEPKAPKEASKRYAAFERSPWLYRPTSNDHALNDQANLALDEEAIPSALTPSSPESNLAEFASCRINPKTRDKMLSVLFSVRKGQNQVPSFPSLALLNNIIQVFFVQESYRVDSFIHTGTFEPPGSIPQLILAIISAGSTLISIPAIWKMGVALQEIVRHSVADLWEQNNCNIRNIQTLQAFMICLDIGLWSGFKRQMEIAESFAQPIVVMLRRAGAFAAQRQSVIPSRGDSDASLQSKWKKWSEAESYKRLIIHLFIHDIDASIGLQKSPLIYLTELKFTLPAARDLWLAKTATQWKDLYLTRSAPPSELPTLVDAIQNIDVLDSISEHIDVDLCVLALIHGFWGQIWAYHESKRFYPESKSAHRLCLMTEHRELYRDIAEFAAKIPSMTRNATETTLLVEHLMMLLHTSPDELQRFVGKYGEDEARQAAVGFRSWSQSSDSRTAVWHAGQVLRAAKRLAPTRLRGFNAIAVYYASLTLWIYGFMIVPTDPSLTNSRTAHRPSGSTGGKQMSPVILNETETPKSRMFLSSDEGIPGLITLTKLGETLFVPLDATDRILQVAREIYRNNFPVLEEPLPPLVDNLGSLLRDLSSLPGSRGSRAVSEVRNGFGG